MKAPKNASKASVAKTGAKTSKSPKGGASQGFDPAGPIPRRVGAAVLVWLGLAVLALILAGCPRLSLSFALDLLFTLALVGSELLFLKAIFREGRSGLLPAWKKFTGYALVLTYVFQALPRIGWKNDGLIGPGRTVFIFVLSLLTLGAGIAAFVMMGRPRTQAAFGIIGQDGVADRAARKRDLAARQKPGFLPGLLEWVDAIAFAAIAVILINIFVFQLYVIPSESMVPTFLVSDRPFTVKLTMGPRIPLTEWRLPALERIKRGDIVTIANPRYPENHEVNVRKQLSQFVYMLTFTLVNLDTDAAGQPKPDPLVKRVVGVPGEQLMMVDDVLYARSSPTGDFAPVADDQKYADVDLWKVDPALKARIKQIPIDQRSRTLFEALDARKNGLDQAAAAAELRGLVSRIAAKSAAVRGRAEPDLGAAVAASREAVLKGLSGSRDSGAAFLSAAGPELEPLALALALRRSAGAMEALEAYATSAVAAAAAPEANAYLRASRSLNLLIKQNLLARTERNLDLLQVGTGLDALGRDAQLARLEGDGQAWLTYLLYSYDMRNFPTFPADRVLGPEEYFAMGDNRYNSLDFRFVERSFKRSLDPGDAYAIQYLSSLQPFALERPFIEGKASFILWPFSRFGAPKR